MNKTGIEYLDYTWNPIAMRCTKVSPACDNCWHLRTADRLVKNPKLLPEIRQAYAGKSGPFFVNQRLDDPLKIKRPSIIGAQFMGDLFHPIIPSEWIIRLFSRMIKANWHTFIICTKRTDRAYEFCREWGLIPSGLPSPACTTPSGVEWPANVVFMFTAENQKRLEERCVNAFKVPAKVHALSVEPMLGPIDFNALGYQEWNYNALTGLAECPFGATVTRETWPKLDWVICGGETGKNARPMNPDWARSVRDQCQAAGVPFFFKQWGDWAEYYQFPGADDPRWTPDAKWLDSRVYKYVTKDGDISAVARYDSAKMVKVGTEKAGRLLDGRTWEEMPPCQET